MDTDKQSRPAAPEPGRRDVSATPEVKKTVSAPDVVSDPLEADPARPFHPERPEREEPTNR